MVEIDSDLYPSYIFRDPLLYPQYMGHVLNASEGVARMVDSNVRGDPFLNSYIEKLDEEIFSQTLVFDNSEAEAVWEEQNLSLLFIQVTDEARKHGWAVVQFYEDDEFKVFSGRNFVEWLKETEEVDVEGEMVKRFIRVGVNVRSYDDIGNSYEEKLIFGEDTLTFLFVWKPATNGRRFAEPDLNQAVMTCAYNIRQINGQLAYAGVKPSFLHFVYGDGITDPVRTALKGYLKYVDRSQGIGAKKNALEEINVIANGDITQIQTALDTQLQILAGVTRLPLSFYIGERTSGGMSGNAENTDTLKVDRKKEYIFGRMLPLIKAVMVFKYGIVTEIEMEEEKALDEVTEEEGKEDEQGTETTD